MIKDDNARCMYVSPLCYDKYADYFGPKRFGYSWHTMVRPVVGFRIEVERDVIVKIENIQFESTKRIQLVSKGSKYLFMLVLGEKVIKVEHNFTDGKLCGLRFTTTTRISQWFGSSQGRHSSIIPKDGYFINSFVGVMYREMKCKLGAVMHPFRPETPVRTVVDMKKGNLLKHKDSSTPNFIKTVKSIRALIVHCPESVTRIDVLSPDEYNDYVVLSNEVDPNPYDHWLELVGDEKLVSVKVSVNKRMVTGIRFATSKQESQWFGTPSPERSTFTVAKDQSICGFYGNSDTNGLSAVGVAVMEQ